MRNIKDFSITKSTVESYKVRHPSGMYWADITIDVTGETSGRIQVASDYGCFQNYWGACGKGGFKAFLLGIDKYYAGGKFGQDGWFDEAKTIKGMKEYIIECRLSPEEKRKCFAELKELENSASNESEFIDLFFQHPSISRLYDNIPDIARGLRPQFLKFWDECWQVFLEEIRKEIAANAKPELTAINPPPDEYELSN